MAGILFLCQAPAFAVGQLTSKSMAPHFKGFDGAFVLYDARGKEYFRYNEAGCSKRLSPCSTFKIFNSLVGLETGVVKDENHLLKWDGTKYSIAPWNSDHTLKSAVKESVVWYFQRVATGVGEERMNKYIRLTHYGNEDISGGLTTFWLGSSLKISADEQVEFLKKLYYEELPFSKRSMDIVRRIIRLTATPAGILSGKTGSDLVDGKGVLGWFVGYVEHDDHQYFFATNIQAADGASGRKAREISEGILHEAGLF